jgi:hypothetical protein
MSLRRPVATAAALLSSAVLAVGFTSASVPVAQVAADVCVAGGLSGMGYELLLSGRLVQVVGNTGLWTGIITLPLVGRL